jgi:hypothetical protein
MNLHCEARQAESRKITALKWKAGPFLAKSAPPVRLDVRQFVEGSPASLLGLIASHPPRHSTRAAAVLSRTLVEAVSAIRDALRR